MCVFLECPSIMARPRSGRKKYFLAALVIALITFAVTEVSFRLYHSFSPIFIFKDAGLRWRSEPYSYKFDFQRNSKGFLDIEYPLKKNPELYRIVALGDSFATGIVPYKNNFLTLLEDKLNRDRKSVEVINMGIHGTSPSDYHSILVNESLDYDPDLVLVCFYMGNDFDKSRKRFYEHSYFYMFLKYAAALAKIPDAFSFLSKKKKRRKVYEDDRPTYPEPVYMDIELNIMDKYKKNNSKFPEKAEYALGYLKKIRDICRERGLQFRVVLIPAEMQVDRAHRQKLIRASGLKEEDFDFQIPNRLMKTRLSHAGIQYLDLLDRFVESGESTRLFRPRDTHWNIAGNELAAEAIKNYLLMVPQIQTKSSPG